MNTSIARIVVSGLSYTGTTTLAEEIATNLNWDLVSAGERFRTFCAANGIDPTKTSTIPRDIHLEFDQRLRSELLTSSSVVVEGRIAIWLATKSPNICRVWCYSEREIRDLRCMERDGFTLSAADSHIQCRDSEEISFYRALYGIDLNHMECYSDITLDSSKSKEITLADLQEYLEF